MTDAGRSRAPIPSGRGRTSLPTPPETGTSSPAGRLYRSRYLLGASAAALICASLFWATPFLYTAAAIGVLALLAAFAPARTQASVAVTPAGEAPAPENAMQAILQALPQAGFILDGGGIVLHANHRAARLFRATRPGDPFTATFRWPEIGEALRQAQAGRAGSVEFHQPGESRNHYSVSLSPITASDNSKDFILVTFEDVSEKMAVARMRADFVANASHELRTPLASLTGFIETLLGPARDDPQTTEKFLKIMLDQARRMGRLIDDLLSLSRIEMRVHHRPTEQVELAALLEDVLASLGPLAGDHAVKLDQAAPDEPIAVIGERDELAQVFHNLVENAIRYGASGGRVVVSVETRDGEQGRIAVHVQDFGPGIAPEHLPRLTERFYRVDPGRSRDMKGTGLGLAIVKHILTRHGGELTIQSKPGEGARFTVALPAAPARAAPAGSGDQPTT